MIDNDKLEQIFFFSVNLKRDFKLKLRKKFLQILSSKLQYIKNFGHFGQIFKRF